MAKKKICFFIGYYPLIKGGAEYQSKILALSMLDNWDVFFISVSNEHPEDTIFEIEGIKVYCLRYRQVLNKLLIYYPLSLRIRNILRNEAADVIYQRVLNSFSFYLAKFAQELEMAYYLHIADKYSLTFSTKSVSTVVRKMLFNQLLKLSPKFITQNHEQNVLLEQYGAKPVLQTYNMHPIAKININEVVPRKASHCKKVIAWIGNARPVKRLEKFIWIAADMEKYSDLSFAVVGKIYDNEYGRALQKQLDGAKNITYYGERDNDWINKFLEDEVFLTVNTSDSEGFSNVFIQSWLRGVPVLSLNSNPDNLFNRYNIGCYHNNSIYDMINTIQKFTMSDCSCYFKVAKESYEISSELFSEKNILPQFKRIL